MTRAEHHQGNHNQLVEAAWEASGGDSPLNGFGGFQDLFDSILHKQRLVTTIVGGERILLCIDERLIGSPALDPETTNYVRMAGEGILNPNAKSDLRNAGVSGVIVHSECGAKGIYAKGRDGHADHIGIAAAFDLAVEAGIPVVGTIDPGKFRVPFHDARVVYYDGTGRFDWSRIASCPLPPGFIVTRAISSAPGYAQTEVDVAIGIAQGHHGYGQRFTDKTPLYLVGVTDNQSGSVPADILKRELSEVAEKRSAVANTGWHKIIRAIINRIRPIKEVKETVTDRYAGLNRGQKAAVLVGSGLTVAGGIAGTALMNQEQLQNAVSNTGKGIVATGEMLSQKAISETVKFDNEEYAGSSAGTQSQNAAKQMQIRDAKLGLPQNPQETAK